MSFLVVSNIVLWIAVISLAVVNYALLRQVGVLYERVAPAGALMAVSYTHLTLPTNREV